MGNQLVYYGNETLKQVAEEVRNIDGDLVQLIDNMYNVMYRERGIGLAAPQVDVSKRLLILDVEEYEGPVMTVINPVIREFSDKKEPYEEGCLSVPGISRDVIRPDEILIAGVDRDGNEFEMEASGILARVLQHEVDHLDGILFVDRLEDYERKELIPDLKKIRKMNRVP